jgi:hypothetical protein
VARQERLVALTLAFQSLEFTGHIDGAVAVISYIKRYHTNGVTGYEELVLLFVVEHKGKDAAEVFEEVDAFLTVESKDYLAVATGLKLILAGIAATNLLVVINLTIDSQYLFTVWREQGLTTTLRVNDAQSLMGKDGRAATVDTTPVRSAVTDLLTHLQRFITQSLCLLLDI